MNIYDSFTCFLEHFMFPRKQSIADWRFDQVFGAYLCRCNFNRLTLFEYYDNWLSAVRMSTVEKWKLKELIITRNWIGNTGRGVTFLSLTSFLVFSSITWQNRFFIRISFSENSFFIRFQSRDRKFSLLTKIRIKKQFQSG